MTDNAPQFEQTDKLGVSESYCGTTDATGITLPASPGAYLIDEIAVRCSIDQPFASRLEFSFDSGTNWHRLAVGEAWAEEPRGNISQIKIRAAGALSTAQYEIRVNRGPL